jgi:hypothetical protein
MATYGDDGRAAFHLFVISYRWLMVFLPAWRRPAQRAAPPTADRRRQAAGRLTSARLAREARSPLRTI